MLHASDASGCIHGGRVLEPQDVQIPQSRAEDDDVVQTALTVATASWRRGDRQDALKWLSMAFEKLEDAEIAAHYGEVLWKNNQKEEAEKVWQIGLEANAEHPVLLETLKRLKP